MVQSLIVEGGKKPKNPKKLECDCLVDYELKCSNVSHKKVCGKIQYNKINLY